VVFFALAIPCDGSASVKVRDASARFQVRAITPAAMPSSAGLSAHSRTSGLGSVSSDHEPGGRVPDAPVSGVAASGF
jgi:hypothetical protein